MKPSVRALAVSLSAFSLLAVCAGARADSKQECAAAYEKTQLFRDQAKLIEARSQAVACSAPTCSKYVTQDCVQWLAQIESMLPTVVFKAVDAAGAEAKAVRVTVDGQVIAENLDGKAVPLDPGEHLVRFELGAESTEQKVLIRQGEKDRTLEASFSKASPAAPAPGSGAPATPPAGGFWNGYRLGAIAAGAVGLAGIGIGAAFGVMTFSQWDEALSHCKGGDRSNCDGRGIALGKDASSSAAISTTGFVVGGVGLAAGALLLILAPAGGSGAKGKTGVRVTPIVGPHGPGMLVEGSF